MAEQLCIDCLRHACTRVSRQVCRIIIPACFIFVRWKILFRLFTVVRYVFHRKYRWKEDVKFQFCAFKSKLCVLYEFIYAFFDT